MHKISEGDLQAKSGSFTTFRHFPIFSFPKNDINGLRRDCLYTDNLPWTEILQMNCDFVITACRSKGQTIEVVEKLANKYNYQVYYVYLMHGERADTKFHNIYIKSNAEAVMEMIKLI